MPLLNVRSVRSLELNISPACKYSGAEDFMYDAVGLVKIRSYAIKTSPDEVNDVGKLLVTAVSETEKRDDPLSVMFSKFPTVPFEPMLMLNKSPVAVIALPGDQSSESNLPEVSDVAVDERLRRFPVVSVVDDNTAPLPEVVGVPDTRNSAAAVEFPPTARSSVVFPGANTWLFNCQ